MNAPKLIQRGKYEWEIPAHGAMRVPAVIFAGKALVRDMEDKVFEQQGQTQIRDVEPWVGANENCPRFGGIDVLDVAEAERLTSVLVGVRAPSTRSRVAVDEFDIGRDAVPHAMVAFLSGKHQPE